MSRKPKGKRPPWFSDEDVEDENEPIHVNKKLKEEVKEMDMQRKRVKMMDDIPPSFMSSTHYTEAEAALQPVAEIWGHGSMMSLCRRNALSPDNVNYKQILLSCNNKSSTLKQIPNSFAVKWFNTLSSEIDEDSEDRALSTMYSLLKMELIERGFAVVVQRQIRKFQILSGKTFSQPINLQNPVLHDSIMEQIFSWISHQTEGELTTIGSESSSILKSILSGLQTLRDDNSATDAHSLSTDIEMIASIITMASSINAKFVTNLRNKDKIVLNFLPFWTIEELINRLLKLLRQPHQLHRTYNLVLDTIQTIDNAFFVDIPMEITHKLILLSSLPWISSDDLPTFIPAQFCRETLKRFKMASVEKEFSSLAKAKALASLSSSLFIPFQRVVLGIFLVSMDEEDFELNTTIAILQLLAKKVWIFRLLPWPYVLNYMKRVVQKAEWQTNPLLRKELTSAISQLPCLYFLSSMSKDTEFESTAYLANLLFSCPACDNVGANGLNSNVNPIPQQSLAIVLKLALSFIRSPFPTAQRQICDLIRITRNHTADYPPQFIFEFADLAAKSHVRVGLVAVKNFAHFFKTKGLAGDTYRENGLTTFFSTLSAQTRRRDQILILINEFASTHGDFHLETLRFIFGLLAKEQSETFISLAQGIVSSLGRQSAQPCKNWELLTRHKYELAPTIMTNIKKEIQTSVDPMAHEDKVHSFISSVCAVGEFRTPSMFAHHYFPVMMGEIVPCLTTDSTYKNILKFLASWISLTPQHLIIDGFHIFFRVLATEHEPEMMKTTIDHIKQDWNLDLLGEGQSQVHINELLSYINEKEERVLRYMPCLTNMGPPIPMTLSKSDVEEMLKKHLMRFCVYADTKLHSPIESPNRKRRILSSLTSLMKLAGKDGVSSNRRKIHATLNSIFCVENSFPSLHFQAWKTFANNLDPSECGDMIISIFGALTKFHQTIPADVEDFFHSYAVNFQGMDKKRLAQLYFIQEISSDSLITKPITDAVNILGSWEDFFQFLVVEARNENSIVSSKAISKLKWKLQYEYSLVKDLLLGREHPIIGTLLSALISAGSNADKETILAIAHAFGYLGALDPFIYKKVEENRNARRSAWTVNTTEFAAQFLNVSFTSFQESENTTEFDCCAFLIQEMLVHFEVEPEKKDMVWNSLPEYAREILLPLLSSNHKMERRLPPVSYPTPLVNSEHGKDFDSWLSNWTTSIASSISKETVIGKVFEYSKYTIARNSKISSFLLPYIATYAILSGAGEKILEEIHAILKLWVDHEEENSMHVINTMKESQAILCDDGNLPIPMPKVVQDEDVNITRATQVVFSVFDHLFQSVKETKRVAGLKRVFKKGTQDHCLKDDEAEMISSLLDSIPLDTLSSVAFYSKDYHRALFYLEQAFQRNADLMREKLVFLQQIYTSLGDVDSLVGISLADKDRTDTLQEKIINAFAKGKIDDGVCSLEILVSESPEDLFATSSLLDAYISLDQPRKAEHLFYGAIKRNPSWLLPLQVFQLKTAVKLKDWVTVEVLTNEPTFFEESNSVDVAMVKVLSLTQIQEFHSALQLLQETRRKVMNPIVGASNEPNCYSRNYPSIVFLHILTEMEQAIQILQDSIGLENGENIMESKVRDMLDNWSVRDHFFLQNLKWMNPVLDFRKSILEILKMRLPVPTDLLNNFIRNTWLTTAKLETKAGNFTRASICINHAQKSGIDSLQNCPKVVLQNVKLLSSKGEKEEALEILKKEIPIIFPQIKSWKRTAENGDQSERNLCSQAMLLKAKLYDQLNLLDIEKNIRNYEECIGVFLKSEKNHFATAAFYDRLSVSLEGTNKDDPQRDREQEAEYQEKIIQFYSTSLHYGCKYVYQSLPRLLTIWVDFAGLGYPILDTNPKARKGATKTEARPKNWRRVQEKMESSIRTLLAQVPAFVLYSAISQVMSRLCHPNEQCWTLLKEILCAILRSHPHQALWMTMGLAKSTHESRKARCLEMYTEAKNTNPELTQMMNDYDNFGQKLTTLCTKQIPGTKKIVLMRKLYPAFYNLVGSPNFGKVLMPVQLFLNPAIPFNGQTHANHIAFPQKLVYINGTDDKILIMNSQIRPKKITLLGSDGKKYGILCKGYDDLRRDAKVMEVINVSNWFLRRNTKSKERGLAVKTFAVVPLNEKHGILEWIPNLTGLRTCIKNLLEEKSIILEPEVLFTNNPTFDSLQLLRTKFQMLTTKYPAVLSEWFIRNFNDPQSWYYARQRFTRTTAVMSIIGYILGLGDRHGENILIDCSTGSCVHVDFNCIFNMGECFETPERVPFRLTQNMVAAMGPMGVDGTFRSSSEITLSVIRKHKDVFLSVLRPFVFDPILDWSSKKGGESWGTMMESKLNLENIKNRIEGSARNCSIQKNTHLSVQAFVDHLLTEAQDIDNLCRMFHGWSAWL